MSQSMSQSLGKYDPYSATAEAFAADAAISERLRLLRQ